MTQAPFLCHTATPLPPSPLLHAPQVSLCSTSLRMGKAGAAWGCPERTRTAQALSDMALLVHLNWLRALGLQPVRMWWQEKVWVKMQGPLKLNKLTLKNQNN